MAQVRYPKLNKQLQYITLKDKQTLESNCAI
jgi:hypothetical protein